MSSTECYFFHLLRAATEPARVFKSAGFAKATRKARITDAELCKAIGEVMKGQADDLGGGVFKKRLNENMHRSIVPARGGQHWIYEYLFAKKTAPTLRMMNWMDSGIWPRPMRG